MPDAPIGRQDTLHYPERKRPVPFPGNSCTTYAATMAYSWL